MGTSLTLAFLAAQLVKKSAWNTGDPGSIPGSGRSPRKGIGYPLRYSWASLRKNGKEFFGSAGKELPAMRETWFWSLGWEDSLEKGMATHSSILTWRIPWTLWSMGLQRIGHKWATSLSLLNAYMYVLHTSGILWVINIFKTFHFPCILVSWPL